MKKGHASRMHFRGKKRKKGDTGELAAQLAPLEEQEKRAAAEQINSALNSTNGQTARDYGAIIVDNDDLKVAKDIIEGQNEKRFLGMEPVVLIVLIILLCFIGFITWQITLMPR